MADQELTVPAHLEGERLDKAVAALLGVSRAVARDLVDRGALVDGHPASPSDRVGEGSVITVAVPDPKAELAAEEVSFGVLYEDGHLIVVDKPAGIVVHPGSGRLTGTLVAGLLNRYPELEGVGQKDRWGLVHRLDKDTSGVLVVARTQEAHDALSAMLRRREITRVYLTLVHGIPGSPTGTVDAPIARDPATPLRRALHPEGKPARTHYRVLDTYPERGCSYLEVRLETGRTHQIRVHLSAIGHPVVGDTLYGPRRQRLGADRIFLHAARLSFTHPFTGDEVAVESPLPADLTRVLSSLGPGAGPIPIA
ncbi:MAG: RluA family pseudouridine synthase [Actinomycetes bacterium]|nr:MAG: RluA family pseudouridine synthase [Actinomycetota bacterium]